jgi:hypothetical protein
VFLLAALSTAGPAFAQAPVPAARSERPYRGLFGGGVGDAEQLLSLGFSLSSGYDDSAPGTIAGTDLTAVPLDSTYKPGWYGQGAVALRYSLSRQKISFGASVSTLGRYSPSDDRTVLKTHVAGVGANILPRPGTEIRLTESVSLQPYLLLTSFPGIGDAEVGQVALPTLEYGTDRRHYLSETTTALLTQKLSHRTTARATYLYKVSRFPAGFVDFATQVAGGDVSYNLAKGLALRAGYTLNQGMYYFPDSHVRRLKAENIEGGIEFNRALSFSRRTTLAFQTGTARVTDAGHATYRLTGLARLGYEVGRTWALSVAYDRSVSFSEIFQQPVFTDGVNAGVNGLITRRVSLRTSVGTGRGEIGVTGPGRGFNHYTTSAVLGVAVTRNFEVGLEHVYYVYGFQSGVALPEGLAKDLHRQNIKIYGTLWEPLFFRRRTIHAPR